MHQHNKLLIVILILLDVLEVIMLMLWNMFKEQDQQTLQIIHMLPKTKLVNKQEMVLISLMVIHLLEDLNQMYNITSIIIQYLQVLMLAIGNFINQEYSQIVHLMELIIMLWLLVLTVLTIGLFKILGELNGVIMESSNCILKTHVES